MNLSNDEKERYFILMFYLHKHMYEYSGKALHSKVNQLVLFIGKENEAFDEM